MSIAIKPTSILIALALCGCQKDPFEGCNMAQPTRPPYRQLSMVNVDGVECVAGADIGISCDWIGYHQREPERQPPDVEAVKRCINALDPDSVKLHREIIACASAPASP